MLPVMAPSKTCDVCSESDHDDAIEDIISQVIEMENCGNKIETERSMAATPLSPFDPILIILNQLQKLWCAFEN